MKKVLSLILALVMCLSLCACGGGNDIPKTTKATAGGGNDTPETTEATSPEEVKMSKDEMLNIANPLKWEEVSKAGDNIAFAQSLIGNTYTFGGKVVSVAEDHAIVKFYVTDEEGILGIDTRIIAANLYLPLEELISLENKQKLNFVGRLDDVGTHDETLPILGTQTAIDMVFKNVAVVSDRFERTGKLHSKNVSYGEYAWNIEFPNSNYLPVVQFRDDVSAYEGQEITYSYKSIDDKCVDAYIVE